jgi:hypothetical protein
MCLVTQQEARPPLSACHRAKHKAIFSQVNGWFQIIRETPAAKRFNLYSQWQES